MQQQEQSTAFAASLDDVPIYVFDEKRNRMRRDQPENVYNRVLIPRVSCLVVRNQTDFARFEELSWDSRENRDSLHVYNLRVTRHSDMSESRSGRGSEDQG